MHTELQGQTRDYLKSIENLNGNGTPTIVFTPNTEQQIRKTMSQTPVNILRLEEIMARKPLENRVYVVPTGKISSEIFSGLISISDFPVFLEGNTAVSTALRLNILFVMYRSLWNGPQIGDLVELEKSRVGTCNCAQAYHTVNVGSLAIEDLVTTPTANP